MDQQIIILSSVVFIAGLLRGFTGFGAVIFTVPFLSIFLGPQYAVPIGLFLDFISGIHILPYALRHAHWPTVVNMLTGALLLIPVGNYILIYTNPEWMRIAIAILVMVFSIVLGTGWRSKSDHTKVRSIFWGGVCGFFVGSAGMGAPPAVVYIFSGKLSSGQVRATLSALFLATTTTGLTSMAIQGAITKNTLFNLLLLTPAFIVGLLLGSRFFNPEKEKVYRYVVLTSLFFASFITIFL